MASSSHPTALKELCGWFYLATIIMSDFLCYSIADGNVIGIFHKATQKQAHAGNMAILVLVSRTENTENLV